MSAESSLKLREGQVSGELQFHETTSGRLSRRNDSLWFRNGRGDHPLPYSRGLIMNKSSLSANVGVHPQLVVLDSLIQKLRRTSDRPPPLGMTHRTNETVSLTDLVSLYAEIHEQVNGLQAKLIAAEADQSTALKLLFEAMAPKKRFLFRGKELTICQRGELYYIRRESDPPELNLG